MIIFQLHHLILRLLWFLHELCLIGLYVDECFILCGVITFYWILCTTIFLFNVLFDYICFKSEDEDWIILSVFRQFRLTTFSLVIWSIESCSLSLCFVWSFVMNLVISQYTLYCLLSSKHIDAQSWDCLMRIVLSTNSTWTKKT